MKVVILGAYGLLGHVLHRTLSTVSSWDVVGVVRLHNEFRSARAQPGLRFCAAGDMTDLAALCGLFDSESPDVVINAIAPSRSAIRSGDHRTVLATLATLPHRLARLCGARGARMIHISSDGVFSGARGSYTESDWPDAEDLYGVAKQLGEVTSQSAINLRLSMLGPELGTADGLLEWFLTQLESCTGYAGEVFSGLPTIVIAEAIRDVILPARRLSGTFHLSAAPITKYDLLVAIAGEYQHGTQITRAIAPKRDRSLVSEALTLETGFVAPSWPQLIRQMHADHKKFLRLPAIAHSPSTA